MFLKLNKQYRFKLNQEFKKIFGKFYNFKKKKNKRKI